MHSRAVICLLVPWCLLPDRVSSMAVLVLLSCRVSGLVPQSLGWMALMCRLLGAWEVLDPLLVFYTCALGAFLLALDLPGTVWANSMATLTNGCHAMTW